MDVERLILHLLAGIFLPLFPLSMLTSYILQKSVRFRYPFLVVFAVLGAVLWSQLQSLGVYEWVVYVALFTSVLYAFRSLSVKDLSRWAVYMFISTFSLIWLYPANVEGSGALLVFLFSFPFLLLFLVDTLIVRRFGSSNIRLVKGLGLGTPLLGFFTTISILGAIGVPTSSSFVNMLLLSSFSSKFAVILNWFLWGWSGVRILSSLVFGSPAEHLKYESLSIRSAVSLFFLSLLSFGSGYLFLEFMLSTIKEWAQR